MRVYNALPLPQQRFLLAAAAAVPTAANAGEDENEPYKVATIASAHRRTTAVVEKHQEQNDIATIAAASVCTVCKKSVHVMYLLKDSDCSYITLRNLRKLCDRGIETIMSKYIFVWTN